MCLLSSEGCRWEAHGRRGGQRRGRGGEESALVGSASHPKPLSKSPYLMLQFRDVYQIRQQIKGPKVNLIHGLTPSCAVTRSRVRHQESPCRRLPL